MDQKMAPDQTVREWLERGKDDPAVAAEWQATFGNVYHEIKKEFPNISTQVVADAGMEISLSAHVPIQKMFAYWLHKARQRAWDRRRRERNWRNAMPRIAVDVEQRMPLESAAEAAENKELIERALDNLRTTDVEIITLKCFEKESYAEIAKKLGVSEPTARVRFQRALNRLREAVGDQSSGGAARAS